MTTSSGSRHRGKGIGRGLDLMVVVVSDLVEHPRLSRPVSSPTSTIWATIGGRSRSCSAAWDICEPTRHRCSFFELPHPWPSVGDRVSGRATNDIQAWMIGTRRLTVGCPGCAPSGWLAILANQCRRPAAEVSPDRPGAGMRHLEAGAPAAPRGGDELQVITPGAAHQRLKVTGLTDDLGRQSGSCRRGFEHVPEDRQLRKTIATGAHDQREQHHDHRRHAPLDLRAQVEARRTFHTSRDPGQRAVEEAAILTGL